MAETLLLKARRALAQHLDLAVKREYFMSRCSAVNITKMLTKNIAAMQSV